MMDFEKAMKFLETAKSIGRAKGVEVSVAILDAAGHPVLVARGKPDSPGTAPIWRWARRGSPPPSRNRPRS